MLTMEPIAVASAADAARRTGARAGFWAAVLTAVVTVAAFGVAATTLPISGPFCQSGCVSYPFHDVAAYVPHDYIWMYPATLMAPIFVVLMVCIHQYASEAKKVFGQSALAFGVIYATVIMVDYYVQIVTLQPTLLNGETEGVALWTQYNPHGVFIALEELAYLTMSVAFVFVGIVFSGQGKLERTVRWWFIGGALVAFATYVGMTLIFGKAIEYRFEVAVITINWTVLIVGGVLLSIVFWRAARRSTS